MLAAAATAVALACVAGNLQAQAGSVEARLREVRAEGDRVRRERELLEAQLRRLEGSARNLAAEAKNLDAQADLTARSVNALDRELRARAAELDSASMSLVRAEDDLLIKQATMRRRLVDIYKRGPLYSFEALLSAESFGELVARYKYLRTVAQDDRARVRRMEDLRAQVSGKRDLLVVLQNDLAISRDQKAEEERRLRSLEDQWRRRVVNTTQSAQAVQRQLQRRIQDEARISGLIAAIDAERKRNEGRGGRGNADAVLSTPVPAADRGRLDWPVDGDLIYPFGRLQNPNNTEIRWDGIGIAAPVGTPVKAVADGVVERAEQFGTYGLCVFLRHGNDYSLYCSLGRATVGRGQVVAKGDQIGVVGVSDPDVPPHLHFQIRPGGLQAVDPLEWLRNRQ